MFSRVETCSEHSDKSLFMTYDFGSETIETRTLISFVEDNQRSETPVSLCPLPNPRLQPAGMSNAVVLQGILAICKHTV